MESYKELYPTEIFSPLFDLLESCQGVIQMEKHHPEGDVFEHSLQCLNHAFRETTDVDLILATMLHDIGKRENSLGHDEIGSEMLKDIAVEKTIWLVRNHMRIHYFLNGEMHKLSKVMELANHPWLPELIHLARFDRLGRNPKRKLSKHYSREKIVELFIKTFDKNWKESK